jgi:ATP phosphoribosyltransferase regulatory subunit HisZ
MMTESASFEGLLRRALTPVEPPADLAARLESALTSLTELAADELDSWELSAMRDPRNWVRPAAAMVVGSSAGAALVVLRQRQRQQQRIVESQGVRDLAQRTVREVARDARRLLRRY